MALVKNAGRYFTRATGSHARLISTPSSQLTQSSPENVETPSANTHYKITLRRSPLALGSQIKGTLVALGIHRRLQTVYHRHSPDIAGKILRVKELVEVENVPSEAVRSKTEIRQERKGVRGYVVTGQRRGAWETSV